MTKLEFLVILADHEWNWKESFKVQCPTCGAEYKDTAKKRNHRKGCSYASLVKFVTDGDYILIQSPTPGKRLPHSLTEELNSTLEQNYAKRVDASHKP